MARAGDAENAVGYHSPGGAMATIKLGELLIKASVLNEGQLRLALSEQKKWGGKLGDVMVRMKLITEDLLVRALAKQLNMPAVNLDSVASIPAAVKERLPARMARDLFVVPLQLRDDNKTLVIAMSEPQNLSALDQVRAACQCRVVPSVASKSAIERAVQRFYGAPAAGEPSGLRQTGSFRPEQMDPVPPDEGSGSFKILDAQNQTRVRTREEIGLPSRRETPVAPTPVQGQDPASMLARFEEAQRREVATVRAMVELLIEKGYFTREEYLAKMRRP